MYNITIGSIRPSKEAVSQQPRVDVIAAEEHRPVGVIGYSSHQCYGTPEAHLPQSIHRLPQGSIMLAEYLGGQSWP